MSASDLANVGKAPAPAVRHPPQAAAPLSAKPLPGKQPSEAFGPFKPFSQAADAGLDAGQRRFVADLIERYTTRTRGSSCRAV